MRVVKDKGKGKGAYAEGRRTDPRGNGANMGGVPRVEGVADGRNRRTIGREGDTSLNNHVRPVGSRRDRGKEIGKWRAAEEVLPSKEDGVMCPGVFECACG